MAMKRGRPGQEHHLFYVLDSYEPCDVERVRSITATTSSEVLRSGPLATDHFFLPPIPADVWVHGILPYLTWYDMAFSLQYVYRAVRQLVAPLWSHGKPFLSTCRGDYEEFDVFMAHGPAPTVYEGYSSQPDSQVLHTGAVLQGYGVTSRAHVHQEFTLFPVHGIVFHGMWHQRRLVRQTAQSFGFFLQCATYAQGRDGSSYEETPTTLYWNKKRILGGCSGQRIYFYFDSITGKRLIVVTSPGRIQFRLDHPMLEWDMTTKRFIFEFGPDGTGYLNPDDTLTPNVIVYAFQQV